ncbi:P-loop containing nucleoside triphosphate hydrolase protein [Aspergillus pseudotamarii]|uniref:P-loop containing nucleoside triphosphate hydrolase protein n=1 Tax=Aspergillus pseudotamarii TaxID=132259 RepID=A0A5N6T957_ASPPS|nr:P-loop containing nucleoside triphosphate hydrolase protein [Aspergillus pseudotamarii]KAE8142807.1 P-loop containing nucleoside triphosphate hydrolase protein [Aspergillus pseudotamarii]
MYPRIHQQLLSHSDTGQRDHDRRDPSGSANFRHNPVHIEAHDVSVSLTTSSFEGIRRAWKTTKSTAIPPQPPRILHNVRAYIPPAQLTVILGGSGSGKTSLLNVLSGRTQNGRLNITGNTTYNGSADIGAFQSAYLVQQDILPAMLTVREILSYAAELSLGSAGVSEINRAVDSIISRLGLENCAETRIGDSKNKGCSGGEIRRVSIGIQLLKATSVLFCDEPTTGLDATTAFQVIQTLKQLADGGMTVVMSLHAPRSDAWSLFDNVILLSSGHLMYSGPSDMVGDYFKDCGYEMPPFVNPADFLLDITSIDVRSEALKSKSRVRVEQLKLCWMSRSAAITANCLSNSRDVCDYLDSGTKAPSYSRVCKVMIQRDLKICWRDWKSLFGIWCAVAALAAINGWAFWQLDGSLSGIRSREGSLWDATGLYGYLILVHEICRLIDEIGLFDHERRDGVLSASAFLLSRRASRFFLEDLSLPLLFTAIYYPMVGYRGSGSQVCIFLLVMLLTHYLAIGFAGLCVATTRSFHGAGLMGNLFFTLQMVASAYFIQTDQAPPYARWLKWVTHTFYTFGALCTNEFIGVHGPYQGHLYDCPFSADLADPRCKQYTGRFVMDSLGMPKEWIWRPIVILWSMTCIFHLWGAIVLHVKNPKPPLTPPERVCNPSSTEVGIRARYDRSLTPVSLCLEDYVLEAKRRNVTSITSRICGPISTIFQPGKLNVIMGASGSGKTSLLSSLSERLPPSSGSKWCCTGSALYNGKQLPKVQIRSMVSFVAQDDGNLMPALTVDETLLFAARLKLPSSMPDSEKRERVSEVITRFGLESCARRLVGSAIIRGISGGEKRRLSIACEILTMPRVLILDEPTSGLDSFMALTVLEVLQGLAAEGCTIILTVHQPTSSMWPLFSTCLLLSPDGLPLYSGETSEMRPYFYSVGFECPKAMNPADFFMDLATSGEIQGGYEDSKKRLGSLVDAWKAHRSYTRNQSFGSRPGTDRGLTESVSDSITCNHHSSVTAFPMLVHRAMLNTSRQPISILARSIQAPGVGLLLALFTAPMKTDYISIQTRMGVIQQYSCLAFIGMLQNVATFPPEVDVMYRETSEGLYNIEAFLAQYTMLELPFEAFSALLFALLLAYAAKLAPKADLFGFLFLSALCALNSGESISMLFYLLFDHISLAVSFTASLLAIFTVLGGVMSLDPPKVLQWFNHISPVKYAVTSISVLTMRDLEFTCTDEQRDVNGKCLIETGEQVLQLYKFDQKNPWLEVLGGVVVMLCYRLLVYTVLKVKVKRLNSRGTRDWLRRQLRRQGSKTTREEERGLVLSTLNA